MKRKLRIVAFFMALVLCFTSSPMTSLATTINTLTETESESRTVKYEVKLEESEHGSLKLNNEDGLYEANDIVSITAEAATGYELDQIEVTADNAQIILLQVNEEYTFTMPEQDVSVIAEFKAVENETETESTASLESETDTQQNVVTETDTEQNVVTETETTTTTEDTKAEIATETETEVEVPERSSRAVGSSSAYLNLRTNYKSLSTGATIFTTGTKSQIIDTKYSGYIKSDQGISVNVSYDDSYVNTNGVTVKAYNLTGKEKYQEDGSAADTLYATYKNAVYYNNKVYDARLVVKDWKVDDGEDGLLNFEESLPGFNVRHVQSIDARLYFYEAGTTTSVTISGYITFRDIDFGQGVILPGSAWDKVYAATDATANLGYNVTANDYPYYFAISDSFSSTGSNPDSQILATFSGSSLRTMFTFVNYDMKTSNGYMGYDSEKVISGPVTIKKYVSDNDESMVTSDTLNQSPEPRKENFYYTLALILPPESTYSYYDNLSVKDSIDSGMTIDSSGITVTDSSGKNVASYFDIAVSSSNIVGVVAKSSVLSTASFYDNTYYIKIPVTIKDTTNLFDYWDDTKDMARIDNNASVTYDLGTVTSNDVHTYVPEVVPPEGALEITKVDSADSDTVLSGVTFTVYEWSKSAGAYKTTAYTTLVEYTDNNRPGVYINNNSLKYTTDNEYKFKVVETRSAADYLNSGWSQEVQFTSTGETQLLTYTVENEKMDPQLYIAKKFDLTTGTGELVDGKYEGTKEAGWYDFSSTATATLTASNLGNVTMTDIIITEAMSAELKAAIVSGSEQYIITDDMKTTNGKSVTVTVDSSNSTILHVSELQPGDSLEIKYKVQIVAREDYTDAQLLNLNNVVTIKGTYNNSHEDKTITDKDDDTINVYNPVLSIVKAALPEETTELPEYGTEITKEEGGYWYNYNNEIHYVIKASNDGNTPLYQTVVTDAMDEDLTAAVIKGNAFKVGDNVTSANGNTVNVTKNSDTEVVLDKLEVGDYVYLEYVVTVADWLTIKELETLTGLVNHVSATSGYKDPSDPTPIPENPKDDDEVNIYQPISDVEKTALPEGTTELPEYGTEITKEENGYWYTYNNEIHYVVKVSNIGNTPLYQLKVTDTMDAFLTAAVIKGYSFVVEDEITSALGKTVNVTKNSNTEVVLDTLDIDDHVYLKFVVTIADWATIKDLETLTGLVNSVKVESGYKDPNDPTPTPDVPEDDDETNIYQPIVGVVKAALPQGTTELPEYGTEITKEEGGYWYSYNNEIHYVIKVSNEGNTELYNTVVTDTTYENLNAAIIKGSAFKVANEITSANGNTVNVTKNSDTEVVLDTLKVGDYVYLEFVVTVADWATIKNLKELTGLVNHVKVTSGYKDPDDPTPIPDEAEDTDIVNIYKALVSITKEADKETYELGEVVTYTMEVSNDGNTMLTNLKVEDFLSTKLKDAIKSGSASFTVAKKGETTLGNTAKFTVSDDYVLYINKLAVGDSVSVTFQVTIKDSGLTTYTNLKNTVYVSGEYGDGETIVEDDDDTATETINVNKPVGTITTSSPGTTSGSTSSAPKTGDATNYLIYLIALLAAAAVIGGSVIYKRKRSKGGE